MPDGNPTRIERGNQFFAAWPDTLVGRPKMVHARITAENVNELIAAAGWSGEIDLFSLDMDGMDHWVLKSLQQVSPRVLVVEYANQWKFDEAVTAANDPTFSRFGEGGASLAATTKLASAQGYRHICVHRQGFNAFFIRDDVYSPLLPTVTPAEGWDTTFTRFVQRNIPSTP